MLFAGALEHLLDELAGSASTNDTFLLHRAHLAQLEASGPIDVLFLGDSSVRASIDPKRFEALTERPALNLGFVSNAGLVGDLYFLDAYLARHGPPAVVVLGHVPWGTMEGFPTDLYLDFFVSPTSAVEHVRAGDLAWLDGVDAGLRSVSRAYRHRAYVAGAARPWLLFDFDGADAARAENSAFLAARAELGYFPAEGAFRGDPRAPEFRMDAAHRRALDAIRARLPATTEVYWLIGPAPEATSFDAAPVRAALPDGVTLLFDRPTPLGRARMADAIHATADGAAVMTASVARALSR